MARKSMASLKPKAGMDEADFYATAEGRRETRREFARALKNGTLVRSAGSKVPRTDPKLLERLKRTG